MYKLKRGQKGLAAIELTLILPIMLLFLFVTVEFSRLLYQYNALTQVVRNASRYISSNARNASTNVIDITGSDKSEVRDNAKALLINGAFSGATQILPNLASATITVSVSGEFITLTASYPWQPVFSSTLPSFVSGASFDLSFPMVTTYTMRAL